MSRDERASEVRSTRRRAVAKGAGAVASGVGLAAGAATSAATHHSYPATYDTSSQVTVTATVQLVRFVNPHVHVVIERPLYSLLAPASASAQLTPRWMSGSPRSRRPRSPSSSASRPPLPPHLALHPHRRPPHRLYVGP